MTLDEKCAVIAEGFADDDIRPPEYTPREPKSEYWAPKVGPIGMEILANLEAMFQLYHGPRGTNKTNIALHKVIERSYNEWNNLFPIYSIIKSSSTEGGAWEKLCTFNLPEWFDGIGLDFTEPKYDEQKNRVIFVSNKFRGWSRIILKSLPHASMILGRIKGSEPGGMLIEELTETDSSDFFTQTIKQLRRPNVQFSPFLATCNPALEGEAHWVYQKFFVDPEYEDGTRNPDYATYFVPMSENVHMTDEQKEKYYKLLKVDAKGDPTAWQRDRLGLWVRRPTGVGLFAGYFEEDKHVIGDAINGIGLRPVHGFPFFISYDFGPKNSCATFMQFITTAAQEYVVVFDEVDFLDQRVLYKRWAETVADRVAFWFKHMSGVFAVKHVSDESALVQWRSGGEGGYDATDFEKAYNEIAAAKKIPKCKLEGCPKGKGSVEARVRLTQEMLFADKIIVSATCPNAVDMFRNLAEDRLKPNHPQKGRLIHKFDSFSYAPFKRHLRPQRQSTGETGLRVLTIGGRR